MSEPLKDTLPSAAPQGTPAPVETQKGAPPVEGTTPPAPVGIPERVFAGKYKSPDELETAYKSLESKIGNKSYAEKLGEQVVQATGYSLQDLEKAGYTPEQIAQAVVTFNQQQPQKKEDIPQRVENSKIEEMEFKDSMRDFFEQTPEAKEFKEEILEWHDHPRFKSLSPEEIYSQKLSKFISKGSKAVLEKQSEKEKANVTVTQVAAPQVDESVASLEKFQKSRHLDDATSFIRSRLAKK